MPKYIVASDGPIHVQEISGDGGTPEHPWVPGHRPSIPPREDWPELPTLPPKDEWPPLPPWFQPGVGLPIPPTPEHPIVPIPPGEEPPVGIWPPVRPEMPDLSGKTLALALIFISRKVAKWHWVVIDHEEAKEAWAKIKDKLPAGGVGGTPPGRPTPGR